MRLVLYMGLACTVHRRHLYPTSPQLVLCIAFRKADAKNIRGFTEILRDAALPNIYRLSNRDSRASAAQGWRTSPSVDSHCSETARIPPAESACIVLSRDIAGCSRKTATRRICWRMRSAVTGPGQLGAPHAGLFAPSRAMATGRPSQIQSAAATGTGIESSVGILLTRAGAAAPGISNPATTRPAFRSTISESPFTTVRTHRGPEADYATPVLRCMPECVSTSQFLARR